MSSGGKVKKFRKARSINIGAITFFIVFIYVLINIYLYFTKDHLTIYEVKEGTTADDFVLDGLIFRDEKIVTTDTAGYINYYHREGERVSKNSVVYSVNAGDDESESLAEDDGNYNISSDDADTIKSNITDFQTDYDNGNFSYVYQLKEELSNSSMQLYNDSMLTNLKTLLRDKTSSLKIAKTDTSGVIVYYTDGYEDMTADAATAKAFDKTVYQKTQLRTKKLQKRGSTAYKIVTDDDWNILYLLNEDQYEKIKDNEKITIIFTTDGLEQTVPVKVFQKGTDYFAKVTLSKYMPRYINQRFISTEIVINSAEGIKIPMSAITEKKFYKVPISYFTKGGDSGKDGLIRIVTSSGDSGDKVTYEFVPTDIYYQDENYAYVDTKLFNSRDIIKGNNDSDTFMLEKTKTFKGVYNVNKGYAVFRRIEILYENEEYCIVKKNTPNGLSIYDHIALDSSTATEQSIIY
ncbi:HlyD family efflux transporter periplasmic adaptor subunit [Anaerocolumna xylanovorans]|uniref:RND related barrel-sandwich hybrid domain-containing protein n=1 Tax=Anaerocolumna xylanovorans DSM 12503 TaxID=1121345 RepID=A0A1M7Y212_9FIRM|nr:HlyD family efflux transporter periplasmic adaptor subunit [Anaerocolumna xylanovorans]SHO45882.1 hypothetical protein SAMN02745217_01094 [Anaerocolumna xylanovorans DSM 12503]